MYIDIISNEHENWNLPVITADQKPIHTSSFDSKIIQLIVVLI